MPTTICFAECQTEFHGLNYANVYSAYMDPEEH